MRRYELTDEQWALIADLFPEQRFGRPRNDDRQVLDGILWVLCSGAAWRDLPERYGCFKSVNHRFNRWKRDGTFDRILERLHMRLDERGLIDYATWMVDATMIRASKAAAGARKRGIVARRLSQHAAYVHPIRRLDAPEAASRRS